ncbi:hypothetical protein DESUT3_12950 [Desulfuromonas versatilis]|uniref:Uncharacterized protein n=1 Tax=Desulfuromonas versatilis TaxID=2802975 RepID=A0ABM8HNA5_9BACT|nr:hypothetical protein [Desulfuromonas versatilis]BCR04226.1 hypothetical protein DESUT3_12950 [Desulfuromonas versatilis]
MKKRTRSSISGAMVVAFAVVAMTASTSQALDFDTCHQQCKDLYLGKIDALMSQPTSAEVRSQVVSSIDTLNRCVADCAQGISPLPAEPAAEPVAAPLPVAEPEPAAAPSYSRKGKR